MPRNYGIAREGEKTNGALNREFAGSTYLERDQRDGNHPGKSATAVLHLPGEF